MRISLLAACIWLQLIFCTGALASGKTDSVPGLTEDERQWLVAHPVVRIAPDPNFAPIEWFNQEGIYSGVTADYIKLLEQRLGIELEVVRGANWSDILERVKQRKVDALSGIIRTEQREDFLVFTQPYFRLKRAIFSDREIEGISTLKDLSGYKIAVVKGGWMDEQLSALPDMSVNRFQDLTTALIATSRGVTDVTGSALDSSAFLRRQQGLLDLQPIAELQEEIELSIGVRNDWPQLASILEKALATVTPDEQAAIRARWLEIDEPAFWEKPVFQYSALALLTSLLLAMAAVIGWNRTLNARVQKRGKQLEAAQMQLIQAEKMESVGRLSAGIAHEVKNPLAIIQMGADYLSEAVEGDETVAGVIGDIDDAVHRADTVIKGLLDFSHNDKLELKKTDLSAVVDESIRLVKHEMQLRNIDINKHFSAAHATVEIDANKIQQVLINLLMNSAHAINRDGSISVTLETKGGGNGKLELQLSDTGPGISDENLQKLFDPFFTTKPVGEGTGLGLSVSRKIIELHHGTLAIRNGPAGGAMVTIVLEASTKDDI